MKVLCPALVFLLLAFSVQAGSYRFPNGERSVYSVHWGLVPCGTVTISCDDVVAEDEELIRVRVRVQSNWLASRIYPVDDTVDCYIDPETQLSVRLEKDTREGDFVCKDTLVFDRENNTAQWDSQSANISTNYSIAADSCDAVSFLYAFRQYTFAERQSRDFNLAVDGVLHGITITAGDTGERELGNAGDVLCRKYVATPGREDLFVRKVPREIWITEDERKIMTRMVLTLPVGNVRVQLKEYQRPGG
jgi:hypothetical protein